MVPRVVLDEAGGEGVAVQRIDHQERPGAAVVQVVLQRQRRGEPQLGVSDVVEFQRGGGFQLEVGEVQLSGHVPDQGLDRAGAVLDQHLGALAERFRREPAQGGVEVRRRLPDRARRRDRVPAGDVELVREAQRDGLRGHGLGELAAGEVDPGHRGGARRLARGQDADLVPQLHGAFGDLARVGAVVAVAFDVESAGDGVGRQCALRPDHQLHREAEALQVAFEFVRGRQRLEDFEQGRAVVPGRAVRAVHDVVAVERGHRNDLQVGDAIGAEPELAADFLHVGLDPAEHVLAEVHEVDLVHGDNHVRHAQQLQHGEVPAGLLQDTLAGVNEHDDGVRGGRAGHRVLGVLHVAGAVREDEAAAVRGEVAVGDVDGDALFPLGAQAVGQQGEVDRLNTGCAGPAEAAVRGGAGDGVELVGEDRLGVVQEPAHQGGLAVVDRAGGREAEQGSVCAGAPRRAGQPRGRCRCRCSLEIAVLLAVFHGGLGDAVIGPGGATFGDGGGGNFDHDVAHGGGG